MESKPNYMCPTSKTLETWSLGMNLLVNPNACNLSLDFRTFCEMLFKSITGGANNFGIRINSINCSSRLEIPWDSVDWTMTITALWEEKKYSTPLWMYLKKSGLPDEDDFDKV